MRIGGLSFSALNWAAFRSQRGLFGNGVQEQPKNRLSSQAAQCQALEILPFKPIELNRLVVIGTLTLFFALLATFRNFGFDLAGTDGLKSLYPDSVADGWGLWYQFARLGLDFNVYFLALNAVLALQIFTLGIPGRRGFPKSVSVVLMLYLLLWNLFGQARYGMAISFVAWGALSGSLVCLIICGLLAFLVHRAIIGGVLLLLAWHFLRRKKHGLVIATVASAITSYIIYVAAHNILVLVGYGNYLNWDNLPATHTALKYYYSIAVLLVWKVVDGEAANSLLILTLLFLPFSYFNVFAGRAFVLYAVLCLTTLLTTNVPRFVKNLILPMYVADLAILVFVSGLYF